MMSPPGGGTMDEIAAMRGAAAALRTQGDARGAAVIEAEAVEREAREPAALQASRMLLAGQLPQAEAAARQILYSATRWPPATRVLWPRARASR